MATFPSSKPTTDVEGSAADTYAKRGGSNAAVNKFWNTFAGTMFFGGGDKSSSKSSASASTTSGGGRSAEFYHNQDVMKERDWTREQKGKDRDVGRAGRHLKNVTSNTSDGRTWKSVSADGKGGFKYDWENAPAKPTENPQSKGQQFAPAGGKKSSGRKSGRAPSMKDIDTGIKAGNITEEEAWELSPKWAQKKGRKNMNFTGEAAPIWSKGRGKKKK